MNPNISKKLRTASAVVCMCAAGVFATHWTPDPASPYTFPLILQPGINPTLNGAPLHKNVEIGVFAWHGSNLRCVGDCIWDSVHAPSNFYLIYQDPDALPDTVYGAVAGDTIYYMVWDSSIGIASNFATVTYSGSPAGPVYVGGTPPRSWTLAGFAANAPPAPPALIAPGNGATGVPNAPSLAWGTVNAAASYHVQISTNGSFAGIFMEDSSLTSGGTSLSGLSNYTTYYWRVRAKNGVGAGLWSSTWSFTTIVAAPSLVSPADGAVNRPLNLTLAWNTVSGSSSYRVQLATISSFASTIVNDSIALDSEAVGPLTTSTTYYWRVNATGAEGTGAWSAARSFATIPPIAGVPALVSPANGAASQPVSLALTWGAVSGASAYGVQVSTISTFTSTVIDDSTATSASETVGPLANAATYYWRVNAINGGGASAWSEAWSFTTAPAAPALLTPPNAAADIQLSPTLTWAAVAATTAYRVQLSTINTFTSTVLDDSAATSDSEAVGPLARSATYYWRVNATGATGVSAWSGAWSFTTIPVAPAAPALLAPANAAADVQPSPTLTWTAAAGAAAYWVQVSTVNTFASMAVNDSTAASDSLTVGPLAASTTYYWRVNAANPGGTSAWTDVWSFRTVPPVKIPVGPGWNVISLNVHPRDSTSGGLFSALRGFVLVKTLTNVYWPGQGLYNFDTLHAVEGAQLYSDSIDTILQSGNAVDVPSTPIPLSIQWNLVSYLPQDSMPVQTAVASIASPLVLVKNGTGKIYWPDTAVDINSIGNMKPGAGYYIYVNAAASLVYPAGAASKTLVANKRETILLPDPRHYALALNTGNNATILSKRILLHGAPAPDGSEVGVFDGKGDLVGSGVVIHGATAFSVWGKSELGKASAGCKASERMTFRLWDGRREYPLDFHGGVEPLYARDGLFLGSFAVESVNGIAKFALADAYPNPFRGAIRIFFDVAEVTGGKMQHVEIDVYDLKGSMVARLANGVYKAGHYNVSWNGGGGDAAPGSNMFIVRMKAADYEKQLKLFRVK